MRPASPLDLLLVRLGIAPAVAPGLDPDVPPANAPGDERYAIGRELGSGGQGRVVLGVDRGLRRSVAIKVLPSERVEDPAHVQAFIEEAIITGGLSHPNIVPAYDLGYSRAIGVYYTMKRIVGRTLDEVLSGIARGLPGMAESFGLFRLLEIFVEVCQAVVYAHSRGVIHTDLKPANVLLGIYGEVWVADWGLAQVMGPEGEHMVRASMRAGTPETMSPEQIAGAATDLDVRTDVWALGVILYMMLTLRMPFEGKAPEDVFEKVLGGTFVRPSERAPDRPIPPAIEQVCLRALRRDPDERFPTVQAMLQQVEAFLEATREEMRKAELAREAVDRAYALLAQLQSFETGADAILDAPTRSSEELERYAMRLLAGYESAAQALLRGFDQGIGTQLLDEAASDIYWRVFLRVYPWLPGAGDHSPKKRASELMATLSKRSLTAVVRMGRRFAPPTQDPAAEDDWLRVVMDLCTRRDIGRAVAFASTMSGLADRIALLRSVSLFSELSACDLLPIAEACREVRRGPGEPYFFEGDKGDALYVLIEGEVEVILNGAPLGKKAMGEAFGEIAVLEESPRTATIVSAGESRSLALDAQTFRRIVRADGEIAWALLEMLSNRMRETTAREKVLRTSLPPPPR